MIKASELRIGNLVSDEFYDTFKSPVIQVESINEKGINLYIEGDMNWPELQKHWIEPEYTFEKLRGIPLTEEWLVKFGFKKNPVSYDISISYFPNNEFKSLAVTINQGILIRNGDLNDSRMDDEVIALINTDISGPIYLHQLQNLYYALTGNELTFK